MAKLHPAEVQLLKRYAVDLDQLITKLVELKGLYEIKRDTVESLRLLIDSHVMWIGNTTTYSINDAKGAWQTVRWILNPTNLKLLGTKFVDGAINRPS